MTVKSKRKVKIRPEFWRRYRLDELNESEWESLCDGCGRCCLICLEDEDTGDIWESNVSCQYFNPHTRKCGCYMQRSSRVPGCVSLTAETISSISWMPESCAYRLLDEGKPLPQWHPLLTKNKDSVVEAGIAVCADVLNEAEMRGASITSYVTRLRQARRNTK